MLLTFSVNFPDNIMNGIMSKEGRELNICISNSVELGNIVDKFPNIGDIAKPGREVRADIDHIAINVIKDIVPCPVLIFMFSSFE